MKKTVLLSLVACLLFSGCSSVTIRDQSTQKLTIDPTWEKSEPFFLWGLVGTAHVNTDAVCGSRNVVQLQTQKTFVDGLLGFVTLGIYAPRSAKVWCN